MAMDNDEKAGPIGGRAASVNPAHPLKIAPADRGWDPGKRPGAT